MSELGKVSFENNLKQVVDAINELSKQIQAFQQASREESEKLEKFKEEETLLEFVLVTSGLVSGRILWLGNQSVWVKTDSGQKIILYKHAIAFIQEKEDFSDKL